MKDSGEKILKTTGALEVIIGITSIVLIVLLLKNNSGFHIFSEEVGKNALWSLILLYGFAGLRILAGIFAIAFAKSRKHIGLLMFFGILLVVIQAFNIITGELSPISIIIDVIIMLIPVYYIYGVYLNAIANAVEMGKSKN